MSAVRNSASSSSIGRPVRGEQNGKLKDKSEGRTDPRPKASSQQVPLGSSDLSEATQLARATRIAFTALTTRTESSRVTTTRPRGCVVRTAAETLFSWPPAMGASIPSG
ncbi:hypothetical protein GCM10010276_87140 [Streptomyces longisporus]|uniref:Uncharacterized protein n=1 Tax=Streptomyces longisporus TaxID=1948 RepID=A0ABN3NIG0_STRLO